MKLTELLEEIDRLDRDASPSPWQNDGYDVLGAPYKLREMLLAPHVASADQNECDAEFIALARTALPQLAKALQAVMDCVIDMEQDNGDDSAYSNGVRHMAGTVRHIVTDALGDVDGY